jgi:hypothetical protein
VDIIVATLFMIEQTVKDLNFLFFCKWKKAKLNQAGVDFINIFAQLFCLNNMQLFWQMTFRKWRMANRNLACSLGFNMMMKLSG